MTRATVPLHKSGGYKVSIDTFNFFSAIDFLFSDANSPALSGKVGVKRAGVTGSTPQFTKVAKTGI